MARLKHNLVSLDKAHSRFVCECGVVFGSEVEACAHVQAANQHKPEPKLLNCIARQTHYPQPIEIVYEMRGATTAAGTTVPSPLDRSPWMLCPQGSAERSRVTMFGCPNCGYHNEVSW